MINRKTLARLAFVTLILMVISATIGEDRDVLYIVDDIVWYSLIVCSLSLVVLTVAVLAKSVRGTDAKRAN